MKDITIKGKNIKRELIIWSVLLIISFGLNVYSIVHYEGAQWSELFTSLGFVVVISLILYAIIAIVRLVAFFIAKGLLKK